MRSKSMFLLLQDEVVCDTRQDCSLRFVDSIDLLPRPLLRLRKSDAAPGQAAANARPARGSATSSSALPAAGCGRPPELHGPSPQICALLTSVPSASDRGNRRDETAAFERPGRSHCTTCIMHSACRSRAFSSNATIRIRRDAPFQIDASPHSKSRDALFERLIVFKI